MRDEFIESHRKFLIDIGIPEIKHAYTKAGLDPPRESTNDRDRREENAKLQREGVTVDSDILIPYYGTDSIDRAEAFFEKLAALRRRPKKL